MNYSLDLRKRVLDFLNERGSKAEASRTYKVSRTCICKGLAAEAPLRCEKPGPRGSHRLDYMALRQHVADFPDQTQLERATHFEVSNRCICYALGKLNIRSSRMPIVSLFCKIDGFFLALGGKVLVKVTSKKIDKIGFFRYNYLPEGHRMSLQAALL